MKTVLVLPAYNEEGYIGDIVHESTPYVDEVVVVDDGSHDQTYERARRAGATVLKHPLNLGKSGALKSGCELAVRLKADIIILMDSDGQHLPADIPRFVQPLAEREADIVIGSRVGGHRMPFERKWGNKLLEWLTNLLYGIDVPDIQSGYRAFRTEHYPLLKWDSRGYHVDAEITIRAGGNKLKYKNVQIQTIYNDPHKGMTVLDGLSLILQIFLWKFTL